MTSMEIRDLQDLLEWAHREEALRAERWERIRELETTLHTMTKRIDTLERKLLWLTAVSASIAAGIGGSFGQYMLKLIGS